jgi:hypothetical protein
MRELVPGHVVAATYRLGSPIHRGHFGGSVWRGWTVDSQQRVTLVFPSNDDDAGRVARRFLIVSAVQHPHLATPIDHGFDDGRSFIAYEGLEGETLATASERGRFTVQEILRLAEQLLGALEVAHERGLVHGALDGDCVFLIQRSHGVLSPKILGIGLDAGPGRSPEIDVIAVADALADIVDGVLAAATPDTPVPEELAPILARARDGAPELQTAAELRAALDDIEHQRRPRTGRDARVQLATAPSMKRAMHDVMLQTSEQAAIPLDELSAAAAESRPVTGRRPRTLPPEPLVPVLPIVRVALTAAEPIPDPALELAVAESPAGAIAVAETLLEIPTEAIPAAPATPLAARRETLIGQPRMTAAELAYYSRAAKRAGAAPPPGGPPAETDAEGLTEADISRRDTQQAIDDVPDWLANVATQERRASEIGAPASQEWVAPPRHQRRMSEPSRAAHIDRPAAQAEVPQPRTLDGALRAPADTRPERPSNTRPGSSPVATRRDAVSGVPSPTIEVPVRGTGPATDRVRGAGRGEASRPAPPSWAAGAVFAALAVLILVTLATSEHNASVVVGPVDPPAQVGPATGGAQEVPGPVPGVTVPGPPEPGPGGDAMTRLTLRSTPSNAVVSYEGGVLGRTPIELEVPAGSHRFDLAAPGYRPLSVNVEGRGSQSLTHEITLERLPPARAPSPAPPGR